MALDQDAKNLAEAIRQVETGNRPVKGASGELASRYQFMPGTWRAEAKRILGDENAPLTLENENRVAYTRIKEWKDKGFSPAQIASMWNSGKPDWEGRVGVNKAGVKYDVPAYVAKVGSEYEKLKAVRPAAPASVPGVQAQDAISETIESNPDALARGVAKTARVVAPLGESVGAALAVPGAKKMQAETVKIQEGLTNSLMQILRNPNVTPENKQRALRAMQASGASSDVIGQSGAFEETAGQTVGKGLLTAGSLLAGQGAAGASRLGLKGASGVAVRTGAEAALGGATFGLGGGLAAKQRGPELQKSVLTSALISGAFNLAAEGGVALANHIAEKLPGRTLNSILRTKRKDFLYGKNPGQGVVDEGIVANSSDDLLRKINAKRLEVGAEIGAKLKEGTAAGKRVDFTKAMEPIDEALAKAVKRGDKALYARLNDLRDEMVGIFKEVGGGIERVGTKNIFSLTPENARVIKTELGEATRWTGQPFDGTVNSVRGQIYGKMDRIIDAAVPAVKTLNERYANLLGAEKALEKAITGFQGQNLVRLNTLLTGLTMAGGAGAGAASGGEGFAERVGRGVAGAAIAGTLRSPATLTRFAQVAKGLGGKGVQSTVGALKNFALSALQGGNRSR